MKRLLIAAAIVAAAATAHPTIYEDEVGWNCRTMGNQVCGPAAPSPGTFSHPLTDAEMDRIIAAIQDAKDALR